MVDYFDGNDKKPTTLVEALMGSNPVVNTGKMSSGTILTKTGTQATILLYKATGKSPERDEYSTNERRWGNDCTDDPAGRRSQGIYHNGNCGDVLHHVRILSKRLEC